MRLSHYILRRLILTIFVLFGLSLLIFSLTRIFPGDPARLALGSLAPQWAVDKLREEMHLNDPLLIQYYHWLNNALHGDLGRSLFTKRPVWKDVIEFFPATLELVIFSTILEIIISIAAGVTAGRRVNSWFDNTTRVISYVGVAIPNFVWAILGVFTFGYIYHILPCSGRLSLGVAVPPRITGMITIDALLSRNFETFFDTLRHMILPGVASALVLLVVDMRIIRSSVVDNLKKEYIIAETSYGMPERIIVFKYLMKPSLIPAVSVMGMNLASSLGGSFIIESIFNWPGFGRYGMNAMLNKDLNSIVAVVMLIGIFFAIMNIIVDVMVAYLDPRIIMGGGSR